MAENIDDIVLKILREIQATLAEHGKMHDQHRVQFDRLNKRLDDMSESMYTALGLAAHSNIRHDKLDRELDEIKSLSSTVEDLRRRLEKLEERTH